MSRSFGAAVGALAGIFLSLAVFVILIPAYANMPKAQAILIKMQNGIIAGLVLGILLAIFAIVLFIISLRFQ